MPITEGIHVMLLTLRHGAAATPGTGRFRAMTRKRDLRVAVRGGVRDGQLRLR